jgi:hypothetical protein
MAFTAKILLLIFAFLFVSLEGEAQEAKKQKPAQKNGPAATVFQASGAGQDFTSSGQAEVARGDLFSGPVTFTQVKQTLTILFDNAKASLGNSLGNVNEPLNATWVGAIRVPANMLGGSKAARLAQQLRGSVNKDEGARVTLTLNLGSETFLAGQNYVLEFPFGKKMSENIEREFHYKSKTKSFQSYTATIIITIERHDPKALAIVSIDSLDVINKQDNKPAK